MKVLIDTNVVLDVLCKREGFYEDAARIMKYCEVNKITGVISALTIPNIVYIMRKELDAQKTRDVIEKLQLVFTVADLKADDIKKALSMDFKDFEDALQSACASRIKADYIITRNIRDFVNSKVTAIKPTELLERI
ncbi:MAG: PIN domain-containing protein [Hominilimicola sp.]